MARDRLASWYVSTASALNSAQDLASIPTARGDLSRSRLAIARLQSAGVPVVLRRVVLAPEVIADPEERLTVRSQVALLDEVAIALNDDCLGFTLARDRASDGPAACVISATVRNYCEMAPSKTDFFVVCVGRQMGGCHEITSR